MRSFLCSALKTITAELPPDGKIAATACAKLTPKLLGQIQNVRSFSINTTDVIFDQPYSRAHPLRLLLKPSPFYPSSSADSPIIYQLPLTHHLHWQFLHHSFPINGPLFESVRSSPSPNSYPSLHQPYSLISCSRMFCPILVHPQV